MMNVNDIKQYCLEKYRAEETYPFGDVPICYKLNSKIFAQVYPYEWDYKITLKFTKEMGEFYRMVYPEKVFVDIIVHLYSNHIGIQYI